MVVVQNWPFFHHFFWGNIGKENLFYDILERKNNFLGYKNKKLKTEIFPKGLVHSLGQKWPFFLLLSFGNLNQENVFHRWGNITRHMCFLRGGTHITRGMCFLSLRTHVTRDICFPGGGTHITRDMCFSVRVTHIPWDTCFPCKKTLISRSVFHLFFFGNIGQVNVFFMIFQNEKRRLPRL